MRPNEIGDGRGEGVRRLHERRGMGDEILYWTRGRWRCRWSGFLAKSSNDSRTEEEEEEESGQD